MTLMDSSRSSLSPELRELCEQASREYDTLKLLEITTRISELLEKHDHLEKRRRLEPLTCENMPWRLLN